MSCFEIKRKDGGWWVLSDGETVAGPYDLKWRAEDRQEALERKAQRKQRKCMTYRAQFLSDGPHHRMCDRCRTQGASAEDVAV